MDLEQYVLESMFEKSLFTDLSLAFFHTSASTTMRFNVHKAMVAQSPFLRLLLDNAHCITTVDTPSPSSATQAHTLHLTIDLMEAMTRRGFKMTPSTHIIRRQWQPDENKDSSKGSPVVSPGLSSSHLRFALKWLYSMDRPPLLQTLKDEDTLRVLSIAVLFELDELVQGCVERYTTEQLSIHSIINDLELICQLPRQHTAYHQLRDATLLLLLRYGPDHPVHLAQLPVDYMSDVLSVDMLYVGNEYDRYCLIRQVLMAYMHSVGKITWTSTGPVDQDFKRLSGFVRNPLFQQQQQQQHLTASDVRLSSQKRKRIPSEELVLIDGDRHLKHQRLTRLSFSACIPFKELVSDASSGGVIDKATILSYLLRTTVNYSNMTFDQLAIVRQDGIVDESIVFRALWQREALERLLYPFNYQQSQVPASPRQTAASSDKRGTKPQEAVGAALDEYFDVAEQDDRRRRILLGSPRFRFGASVDVALPWDNDEGWDVVEMMTNTRATAPKPAADETTDMHAFDDDDGDGDETSCHGDDDDDDSVWACEDEGEALDKERQEPPKQTTQTSLVRIYNKTMYSGSEYVLGYWHRVRLEAQILPRSLVQPNSNDDTQLLVCKCELERDLAASQQDQPAAQTKTRYDIYCLNRHQVLEADRVDPEDRVLVPVSKGSGADDPGYVDQIILAVDGLADRSVVEIDMMVALEIFGFSKV